MSPAIIAIFLAALSYVGTTVGEENFTFSLTSANKQQQKISVTGIENVNFLASFMQTRGKYAQEIFLLSIFFLTSNTMMAQEICNNGKDDDGDGLIDLQDPDCQCHFTVTNNLLLNGSFELYNHCPVIYTYDSNYNAAAFWQYGTYSNEADYYHNLGAYNASDASNFTPTERQRICFHFK